MRIFLIRHGESTSDVENRYGGDYDDSLTKKGKDQAVLLANKLKAERVEVVFSSPRARAYQTAIELGKTLRTKVTQIPELKERNFYGILTGMKKDEAIEKYPELVPMLEDRRNTLPNGENYADFEERIRSAWSQITATPYETVAVVTHAGPIRCIFRELLQKGELASLGDCETFLLSNETGDWGVV